ncbi:MAG: hypothetical protein K2O44_02215 [Clostridia bacterium]|nr:hypothetical protein [Clostridia bacterium]
MKKIFKGLMCAGLCGILAIGATGCANKSDHRNPETDSLNLAIGSVDQKFNPLFYTSQNDGVIANMTQVSMLTADAGGNLAYGDDFPTVTLDYLETYKNGSQVLGTYDGKGKDVPDELNTAKTTEYEFLIKNGMKFSDGKHDLTVMDVLFNLYVYLDPVYNGSNTIYSTKIAGLQAYRQQKVGAGDDTTVDMSKYYGEALNRIDELIYWSSRGSGDIGSQTTQLQEDYQTVCDLYKEELESTWNSVQTGWRDAYKEEEYRFTEGWEAFYYQVGAVTNQQIAGTYGYENAKDENGKYLTTLDPDANGNVANQQLIDETKAAYSDAKVEEYLADHPDVTKEDAQQALQKAYAVKHVYDSRATKTGIAYILGATATYSNVVDAFTLEALSAENKGQDMAVSRISGISVSNTKFTNHQFNGKTYEEDHDILKITVNGIDPKAKWNFGFSVTPMYYYSDEAHYNAAMKDYTDGKVYDGTATHFGVEFRDIKWFNNVLGNDAKTGLPVGAGAYKCSTKSYDEKNLDSGTFFDNYTAYFIRNDMFHTMGGNIDNAKINRVKYRVTRDDKIVESLIAKEIDYGEPNATASNQNTLRERGEGRLEQITYQAGGYGYVGINPRFVPDMEVRQAIMHAFDTSSITDYFGARLVNIIDRPMSMTSWAYPDNADRYYKRTKEDGTAYTGDDLRNMITKEGNWRYDTARKKLVSNKDNSVLKLTFTIAGESTDHPSYIMFQDAEIVLEQAGMDISVVNSVTALQDLATGKLAVWAAAWSSSIDPDPYQIYSKNSNASSTKNWYKDGIIKNENGVYSKELPIVNALSDKIDEGRATLSRERRTEIYAECLDLIMQLAVEFPTYQRNNLCVYNSRVIDGKTIYGMEEGKGLGKASYNMGPIDELWKVNFVK